MSASDAPLFELDGLFASVDTLPTTPIDEISLPREPSIESQLIGLTDHERAQVLGAETCARLDGGVAS